MQVSSGSLKYRIDFLKYRYVMLVFSLLLLGVGVVGYFIKGGFVYDISFTGGAEIRAVFEKPVDVAQLRGIMDKMGWKNARIQEVGKLKNEVLVIVGNEHIENLEQNFKAAIVSAMPGNKIDIKGIQVVGGEVGDETKWNAAKAIFLSLILILLYIALRSEFRFGVGTVLSLVHDLLFILMFLILSGQAVSIHVLAAVLAVIGYSLNDTIIIFSRIIENFKKYRGHSEYDIINFSINQTLKRTILTSVTTFFAISSIMLLGGEILRGFAMIMGLGVVVGTYSSVYIATAAMFSIGGKKVKAEDALPLTSN
ncbi:MAG: protein translocase subunit SecF [bacterium]